MQPRQKLKATARLIALYVHALNLILRSMGLSRRRSIVDKSPGAFRDGKIDDKKCDGYGSGYTNRCPSYKASILQLYKLHK